EGSRVASGTAGIAGELEGVPVHSPLMGRFNAANIAAAVALSRDLGIPPSVIARGVARLTEVPGRLERVPNTRGIHVLVDYAHKPDALEKVLKALVAIRGKGR